MALTITSPVTLYNNCDSITGWTGVDGIDGTEQIEGGGACASDVDVETDIMLGPTVTAINMSTTKYAIYPWVKSFTASFLDIKANGGLFGVLSDGTNESYWNVNGSDTYPGGFEVMAFNSDATPDGNSGTPANLTSITRIGLGFKGLAKSKLADNSFLDYIRYSSSTALKITGTNTTTDDGWPEVLTGDTTLIAGILKQQTGSFVLKGPTDIGDSAGTLSTTFSDDGTVIIFDESPVGDSHHSLTCIGNGTGATSVTFKNQTFIGAGGRFDFDQTAVNLNTFSLTGGSLTHAGAVAFKAGQTVDGVVFTDSLTTSIANTVNGCTFSLCGQITLTGSILSSIVDSNTALSAVVASSPAIAAQTNGTEFISDGTGNGLEIGGTAANMTLTDVDFTGYSTTVDVNKAIYVNIATGSMTINISGGSGVTLSSHVRTAGATVTVSADTTIIFTNMKDNTEVRIYKTSDNSVVAGIEIATDGTLDARTFEWAAPAATDVYYILHNWNASEPFYQTIRVEGFIIPSSDTSIAIQQQLDRNAE